MVLPPGLRVEFAGAVYQVMARGNERREIFRDDRDRKQFLETLGETPERFGVRVLAYCLMPNHDHLVLDTPRANLSRAMGAVFGSPVANPWEEVRWREREGKRNAGSGEAARGPGERLAATNLGWVRVPRGGERGREVAKAFGYRDGSGVTQVVKRPEAAATRDKARRRRMEEWREVCQVSRADPTLHPVTASSKLTFRDRRSRGTR